MSSTTTLLSYPLKKFILPFIVAIKIPEVFVMKRNEACFNCVENYDFALCSLGNKASSVSGSHSKPAQLHRQHRENQKSTLWNTLFFLPKKKEARGQQRCCWAHHVLAHLPKRFWKVLTFSEIVKKYRPTMENEDTFTFSLNSQKILWHFRLCHYSLKKSMVKWAHELNNKAHSADLGDSGRNALRAHRFLSYILKWSGTKLNRQDVKNARWRNSAMQTFFVLIAHHNRSRAPRQAA